MVTLMVIDGAGGGDGDMGSDADSHGNIDGSIHKHTSRWQALDQSHLARDGLIAREIVAPR